MSRLETPNRRPGAAARPREWWVGLGLIAVSAASFGSAPLFARLAYEGGADPSGLLLVRFVAAGGLAAALVAARRLPLPRGRALLGLVLMGAVGYAGQAMTYYTALTLASTGLVALLLYVYPGIVLLLSSAVLRQRPRRGQVVALAVALAGIALTLGGGAGGTIAGVGLALASALIYALYILAGSRVAPGAGAMARTAVVLLAAAAVYAALAATRGVVLPTTGTGWLGIGLVALVSTVVAVSTFFAGLSRVGPTDAALLSTVEPVVTVVLATLLLGEALGPTQVLGGALILGAAAALARSG